jgi:hypothetical protein
MLRAARRIASIAGIGHAMRRHASKNTSNISGWTESASFFHGNRPFDAFSQANRMGNLVILAFITNGRKICTQSGAGKSFQP